MRFPKSYFWILVAFICVPINCYSLGKALERQDASGQTFLLFGVTLINLFMVKTEEEEFKSKDDSAMAKIQSLNKDELKETF